MPSIRHLHTKTSRRGRRRWPTWRWWTSSRSGAQRRRTIGWSSSRSRWRTWRPRGSGRPCRPARNACATSPTTSARTCTRRLGSRPRPWTQWRRLQRQEMRIYLLDNMRDKGDTHWPLRSCRRSDSRCTGSNAASWARWRIPGTRQRQTRWRRWPGKREC